MQSASHMLHLNIAPTSMSICTLLWWIQTYKSNNIRNCSSYIVKHNKRLQVLRKHARESEGFPYPIERTTSLDQAHEFKMLTCYYKLCTNGIKFNASVLTFNWVRDEFWSISESLWIGCENMFECFGWIPSQLAFEDTPCWYDSNRELHQSKHIANLGSFDFYTSSFCSALFKSFCNILVVKFKCPTWNQFKVEEKPWRIHEKEQPYRHWGDR